MTAGDWIAGFSTKATGYKFVYVMVVEERIHMDSYFHDRRFQKKKPKITGNWKQRCGDNFYSQTADGLWVEHPNPFHEGMRDTDTRVPYVFVGRQFWYLGENRVDTPTEFHSMIGGRGARVNHPPVLVEKFKDWVQEKFAVGLSGAPLDAAASTASCQGDDRRPTKSRSSKQDMTSCCQS